MGLWSQAAVPSAAVPDNVEAQYDVEYSRVGDRVFLDIFRPKGGGGVRPAVLAVHGGGFRRGSRTSYHDLCIKLAQRGYVAATASYRLAPRHQFPAPVEDVKAAVRFLRANAGKYGIDPAYIGAVGASAGGHLVLMLALTPDDQSLEGTGPHQGVSSRVQAVVNYYGPTDLTKSYEPGKSVDAAEVLPMFLGGDLEHNRKQHLLASPLYYVTPRAAPVLSLHGTKDRYVAYEHSVWLTEKLKAAGVPAELETFPDADHGFRDADAARAEARTFAFLDQHLKPPPQRVVLGADHGPLGEIVALEWPSGRELWQWPNARGHDVQVLSGGHVLFTKGAEKKVVQVNDSGQVVWSCCEGLEHPIAAQRLATGNTLIADAGAGKVIEVDGDGKVVWQYVDADIAKMRMRNVRRSADGTTFIAVEADAKVIGVDKKGQIAWEWQAPEGSQRKLYQARRRANGVTLLSLSDPGEILEIDPGGKVLRSIGGAKSALRLGWASGFDFFPNGNLLIADYTGRRLLEVDKDGRVVNEVRTKARTFASVAIVPNAR